VLLKLKILTELIEKEKISKKSHPLLGFFASLKDCLKMKDTLTTSGLYLNLHKKCPKSPYTLKKLTKSGLLILSKGNIPMALFSYECMNNIFGKTTNPYMSGRVPGGSTGGDACLVRLGLANCALGNDSGGSLIIPALFCGLFTLRCT